LLEEFEEKNRRDLTKMRQKLKRMTSPLLHIQMWV